MNIALVVFGWVLIIAAAYAARVHLQQIYLMPSDLDRLRSYRYRRAIRRELRRRRRGH